LHEPANQFGWRIVDVNLKLKRLWCFFRGLCAALAENEKGDQRKREQAGKAVRARVA
jgi:hypothetical protein